MNNQYIAKPDCWFKTGTEVKLVEYQYNIYSQKFGTFEGIYIVQDSPYDKFWRDKGHEVGDEITMTEMCSYDEFEISDKLPNDVVINKLAFDFMQDMLEGQPKDFVDADDVSNVKQAWKLGFKAGFEYLNKLYTEQNELEKK